MRKERAPWTVAVLSHVCAVCNAGPGERCYTATGNLKNEPHADRARVAAAHFWQPVCEHCGNDDATAHLWLCMDCVEGLPDR